LNDPDAGAAESACPGRRLQKQSGMVRDQVSKTKQYAGLLVALTTVVVCLWLVFRDIDWETAIAATRRADIGLLALSALVGLASFSLRALRWQLMLAPVKRIGHFKAYGPLIIGFFANAVLPARAGEVVRAHVLGRQEGISRVTALTSIVVERLLDAAVLLVVAVIAISGQSLGSSVQGRVQRIAIVVVVLLGVAVLAVMFRRQLGWAVNTLLDRLPAGFQQRVRDLLHHIGQGLSFFARSGRVGAVITLSIGVWAVVLLSVWLASAGMHLDLGFSGAALVLAATAVGMVVTVAPGGMGTFELAVTAALQLVQVPWDVAAIYSVILHVLQVVPVMIVGAITAAQTRWWELRIR